MSVVQNVCYVHGHQLQSLVVKEIFDPNYKVIIKQYLTCCSQCGMDRDKMLNYRPSAAANKRRSKTERKPDGNSHTDSASSISAPEGEDPQPVPVAGAELLLP